MPIISGQITLTDLYDGKDYNDHNGEWRIGEIGQGFDFEFTPAPSGCNVAELKILQRDLESHIDVRLNGELICDGFSPGTTRAIWLTVKIDAAMLHTDDVNTIRIEHNGKGVPDWGYIYRVVMHYSKQGSNGVAIVYRGAHSDDAIYYNNSIRRDVVKYDDAYYLYKGSDATSGVWDISQWESFGAQFDSVATSLLLAENANIADWIIKDGKIASQESISSGEPNALLNGAEGSIEFKSDILRYTPQGGEKNVVQTISVSSQEGQVRVSNSDYDIAYISSQGILANRAGVQALPSQAGIELKAAVVALGYGDLRRDAYDNAGAICGIFATSSNTNSDPAPSWGAYINKLRANGLYFNTRQIYKTTYLTDKDTFVSCYNSTTITLYLPASPQEGQMIFISRMNKSDVTLQGNGKQMRSSVELYDSLNVTGDMVYFASLIFDGQYWKYSYMFG